MSAARHQSPISIGVDSKNCAQGKNAPMNAKACGNWHLFTGTVQLFIVGDAAAAWLPCSAPEYRHGEQPGTQQERAIATLAIKILQEEQNHNPDAGHREIRDALARAASAHKALTSSLP